MNSTFFKKTLKTIILLHFTLFKKKIKEVWAGTFVWPFPLIPLKNSYFPFLVFFQLQKVPETRLSCSSSMQGSSWVFVLCGRRMKKLAWLQPPYNQDARRQKGDDLSDRGRDDKKAFSQTRTREQSGARFPPQLQCVYLHTQSSSRCNLGRRREARSATEHTGDQN